MNFVRQTARAQEWEGCRALLRERGGALGLPLHVEEETASTNDLAKGGARSGAPSGATWLAESQTQGRGRQGRRWLSARGEGLLFSTLVRVPEVAPFVSVVPVLVGLVVAETLRDELGLDAKVKWPNDVWVAGRKLAGVLVEGQTRGTKVDSVVIGVGLNVFGRTFPPELAALATSCALELEKRAARATASRGLDRGSPPALGRTSPTPLDRATPTALDRGFLLAGILDRLDRDLLPVVSRGLGLVSARLAQVDALSGQLVKNGDESGTARGIDPDGKLVVERGDGMVVRWVSGEVHLSR